MFFAVSKIAGTCQHPDHITTIAQQRGGNRYGTRLCVMGDLARSSSLALGYLLTNVFHVFCN